MTRARAFVLPALLALSGACASFVPRDEYADYRAVRVAASDDTRLVAMRDYVAHHPDGRWREPIEAERRTRDLETFERGKSDRRGLEFYLRAFPDGVFAAQARSRLGAIDIIEARKLDDVRRARELDVVRQERDAVLRRTWVTRFVGYWARTLLGLTNWGASIEDVAKANPLFSRAFARAPRPRCTTEECVKYYEGRFAVAVPGGTRIERAMRLVLRLRMRDGKLERAELLMPGWGFSRWHELEERRPVIDALLEQRAEAVAWARARAEPLLASHAGTWVPEAGYALGVVVAPSIGTTGESTDTTAEDPGAPSSRIQGDTGADGLAMLDVDEAPPPVSTLVAPSAPEAGPDMVLDPLQVNRDGRPVARGQAATEAKVPATEGPVTGETMVLAPMEVPRVGEAAAASPAAASASEGQMAASPRVEISFRNGPLRVVLFAASTSAGSPAYDGIVIERVLAAPAKGTR